MANKIISDREPDDFFSLKKLWQGKYIILSFLFFFGIVGVIYSNIVNEKWISRAVVTLPSSGQTANYDAALNVIYADNMSDKLSIGEQQRQLFNRFSSSLNALSSSLANLEKPINLKVDFLTRGDSNVLSVSIVESSAKKAQDELNKYLNQVNEDVVKEISRDIKYDIGVKTKTSQDVLKLNEQIAIDKRDHRIRVIEQALKIAKQSGYDKSNLSQAEFLSDDTLYLLGSDALKSMIDNGSTKPLSFDENYYNAKRALLALTHFKIDLQEVKSFRYISNPDLPLKRVSPNRSLIIILFSLLGLVLGSLVVSLKKK